MRFAGPPRFGRAWALAALSWLLACGTSGAATVELLKEDWRPLGPEHNLVTGPRQKQARMVDNQGTQILTVDPGGGQVLESAGRFFVRRIRPATRPGEEDRLEVTLLDGQGRAERVFSSDLVHAEKVTLVPAMNLLLIQDAGPSESFPGERCMRVRAFESDTGKAIGGDLPKALVLPDALLTHKDWEQVWLLRRGSGQDAGHFVAEAYDRKLARVRRLRVFESREPKPPEATGGPELQASCAAGGSIYCVSREPTAADKPPQDVLHALDLGSGKVTSMVLEGLSGAEPPEEMLCGAKTVVVRGARNIVGIDPARMHLSWTLRGLGTTGPLSLGDDGEALVIVGSGSDRSASRLEVVSTSTGKRIGGGPFVSVGLRNVNCVKIVADGKALLVFGVDGAARVTLDGTD